MDLGTALLNTFVVLAVGTALTYLTNDRFKVLRHEIEAARTELHEDIIRLEARVDSGFDSLRSDLTQVALAVGAKGRAARS